jgi:hypothetical protein
MVAVQATNFHGADPMARAWPVMRLPESFRPTPSLDRVGDGQIGRAPQILLMPLSIVPLAWEALPPSTLHHIGDRHQDDDENVHTRRYAANCRNHGFYTHFFVHCCGGRQVTLACRARTTVSR